MKATAMILSLLAVGSLVAAEVSGNNTAVVVQKTAVKSSTGWQFVSVPVDGLDITGSTTATAIAVATLLPVASYNTGTVVYQAGSTGIVDSNKTSYTLTESTSGNASTKYWKSSTTSTDGGTDTLAGGTILWIYDETKDTSASSSVYCGEDRTVTKLSLIRSLTTSLVAGSNDSSAACSISDLLPTDFYPAQGDEIYRLEDGSSEYVHTRFNGMSWYCNGAVVSSMDDIIPAGEAFYYLLKASFTESE